MLEKKYKYFLVAVVLPGLLSGCLGTRYLKENEKLLYHQSIVAPKGFSTDGLSDLYVQKVNHKFLGLPIYSLVWMYYTGAKRYHQEKFIKRRDKVEKRFQRKIDATSWVKRKTNLQYRKQKKLDVLNGKIENGNMFMQWGEKIAVFDSANLKATVDRLEAHFFTKGYFLAKTVSKTTELKRKVIVKYTVEPGPAYHYDSIAYDVADTVVLKLVERSLPQSLIKKGDQFDQDKITKERERIDLLCKDNGYYDFSRQYIVFDIDTTFRNQHKVALRMDIKNPIKRDFHKQFRLDSISFTTDVGVTVPEKMKRKFKVYRNITFNFYKDIYSKKVLSQRVSIRKDSLYSRSETFNTQRQLANLDVFKFVNINYDTSGGRFIANIFSSPLDRYSWTNEAGMTVTQGFPGPYYTMSFRKRNIFGGLESFDLNGRYGFEGVASATQSGNFYKSTEAGLNGTLTFPQFLLPLGADAGYRLGKFNPKTKLLGGYTYTDRPEYQRGITTISDTYTWEKKRILQYFLTLINLNIIRSKTSTDFQKLLDSLKTNQGNNLVNSFKPSFVSSVIFSVTWNPNNYGNTVKSSFYLRAQVESGGTIFNFIKPDFIRNAGLQTYKYLRFNLDMRKNIVIDKNSILAYRFNSGVAYSYGDDRSLPYEKYFFAGGSNGIRAWRPRRLGVGSYPVKLSDNPNKNGLFDYRYEKPGEILLEGSIEYRQKLFGFISGAVFVDAGNVWLFREQARQTDVDYGNTKFKVDQFYKEIAVGTGFGLRFDFAFLVLRLDVGIKAYDPSRQTNRFILNKVKFWSPYGTDHEPVIYNVGIGYPF